MSMQHIMRWGHDFPKDKEGEYLTYGANGKIQMSMGEPIKQSITFLVSFTQSFNYARN